MGRVDILSPHGALRAYTVLLTAEPRRGSLPASFISNIHGPHVFRRANPLYVLSQGDTLRAYPELLIAESF